MAKIYKKVTTRPLSKYQLAINDAAQELCLKNPSLLSSRKNLLAKAREYIIANGFQFAKGKSRSKDFSTDEEPVSKRKKLSKTFREQRLKDVEEDLKDYNEQIEFKEKRITAAVNVEDYAKCDQLKNDIIQLKQSCRQLETEKKRLRTAVAQSDWYQKNKERFSKPRSESDSEPAYSIASSNSHDCSVSPETMVSGFSLDSSSIPLSENSTSNSHIDVHPFQSRLLVTPLLQGDK